MRQADEAFGKFIHVMPSFCRVGTVTNVQIRIMKIR